MAPRVSRFRTYATVGAVAIAAAAIAVGVAWSGRGAEQPEPTATTAQPRQGVPPLALDLLLDDPSEASALKQAADLYESGKRAAALEGFEQVLTQDPGSLDAAVGAAFARWPDGTIDALEALATQHPASALVQLHKGLALFWLGKDAEALQAWKGAESLEPDSSAAVRAEGLLHPDMPPGLPFFVPRTAAPAEIAALPPVQQLAALERRAQSAGTAESWLEDGAALQRVGRPISARAAFDAAVAADPSSVEAQTAAAVGRFDKDDPSEAFGRLGPLSASYPDEPVVQFHFGLCLLWLRRVEEAQRHLEAAKANGGGTTWGREAVLLLERLAQPSSTTTDAS